MAMIAKRKNEKPAPPSKIEEIRKSREYPVPESLLKELPCAAWWFELIIAITDSMLPRLEEELAAASRRNHVDYARAFVTFYKMRQELMKVFNKEEGSLHELWNRHNGKLLPEAIEAAGVTNVPLAEGIRVTVNDMYRASIREGMRDKAFAWLRQNGYEDLVTTTVNSSSLSSLAKELAEENQEFPDALFNRHVQKGMSVTKAGAKKGKE